MHARENVIDSVAFKYLVKILVKKSVHTGTLQNRVITLTHVARVTAPAPENVQLSADQ